jgi:hypothetical protein
MTTPPKSEKIIRAWLLVKVGNGSASQVANHIYNTVNKKYANDEKVFVVRADVVDGPYNLIVPVFTEKDDQLQDIISTINGMKGVTALEKSVVQKHIPNPPHKAHGFVTYQEANPLPRGPIDKVNGHNPW